MDKIDHGGTTEIVTDAGVDYMGCAAISSNFDSPNAPAVHDLMGVFVQPLQWAEAEEEEFARIMRVKRQTP